MTTTPTPEVPDVECRRNALVLLAGYGYNEIESTIRDAEPDADVLGFVLQCLAAELTATSMKLDEETVPSLKVVGAMVAGLFGQDMADDADELLVGLNEAGKKSPGRVRALSRPSFVLGVDGPVSGILGWRTR